MTWNLEQITIIIILINAIDFLAANNSITQRSFCNVFNTATVSCHTLHYITSFWARYDYMDVVKCNMCVRYKLVYWITWVKLQILDSQEKKIVIIIRSKRFNLCRCQSKKVEQKRNRQTNLPTKLNKQEQCKTTFVNMGTPTQTFHTHEYSD